MNRMHGPFDLFLTSQQCVKLEKHTRYHLQYHSHKLSVAAYVHTCVNIDYVNDF